MFERKISREILKTIGVYEPSNLDQERFIQRFKIDKLGLTKKLACFVCIPAFRKFLQIKLEGVLEDDKSS